ncbi:hypothetical protein PIROE2DRAFT_65691 [Piromyces sp. E2]|nr:hypothetical protein PIROE2DRAFT_65691 [Piromyces sp. E2]|eukprot:OUM56165.1 hypothetical protein PIROE2DRAFT_65691 [Piromyces sp. E2]
MTKKVEKRQSYNKFGFKMAILSQTFRETLQNTINNTLGRKQTARCVAPMVDGQIDEATKKVENLKKFIEGSRNAMKKIIESMTISIEAEQSLSTLFSEESVREDKDVDLRMRYIKLGDSYGRDHKELSKYIIPIKNYEEWLNTFLTKAIKDTEDTISLSNQVRIEIQSYASCLADAKNRLRYEVEGSMEHLSDTKIVEESERHLEILRKKFADLKIQLKEKADMLELKRQVDLPNYLDAVHNSIRLYHQAAFAAFTLPSPKDVEVASVHTTNESITSEGNDILKGRKKQ